MFALVPRDVRSVEEVVVLEGTLAICSLHPYVLVDSGSTYSFMSTGFAIIMTRTLRPLDYELLVSQPLGDSVPCNTVYVGCDICIRDKYLAVNLILIDMGYFDAILGMDWLSANSASIDCTLKRVTLRPLDQEAFTFEGK